MRVLVGGIGYRNLRDYSVGVEVVDHLLGRSWPAEVRVEDLSYNPIAVVQRLDDEPPDRRFARAVLVAAASRPWRRPPGAVTAYRWDGVLPDPDAVQQAVGEAVTGVISLDNTLIVGRHFGALPAEVAVVEVEPGAHEYGEALSPPVARAFGRVCQLVARLATDRAAAGDLPLASLGGRAAAAAGAGARAEVDRR